MIAEVRTEPFRQVAAAHNWSVGYAKKIYCELGITSIQRFKRELLIDDCLRSSEKAVCEYLFNRFKVRISERAVRICRERLIRKGEIPDPQLKLFVLQYLNAA